MSTSMNMHRIEEVTVKRNILSNGTYILDIIVTDGSHITQITLFSDERLTIEEK